MGDKARPLAFIGRPEGSDSMYGPPWRNRPRPCAWCVKRGGRGTHQNWLDNGRLSNARDYIQPTDRGERPDLTVHLQPCEVERL